jgi:hypothetical protein
MTMSDETENFAEMLKYLTTAQPPHEPSEVELARKKLERDLMDRVQAGLTLPQMAHDLKLDPQEILNLLRRPMRLKTASVVEFRKAQKALLDGLADGSIA